jgi:iron complex outermembrane receptor protein
MSANKRLGSHRSRPSLPFPHASQAEAKHLGYSNPPPIRRTLLACCIGASLASTAVAWAQDNGPEEITVTGTRIVRSGMVTPTPVTAVQASELESMSAGTLIDALIQLPPFFANQTPDQVNGGQNSGGSNLNLRGAGLNRTLVLLDGRRVVPTNRFGAVDVGMFPEELLRSVETVTGGASASYGTDAVAGVVNFLLDTNFEGVKGHAQMGQTHYGDGETYEAGVAIGTKAGANGHILASIETYNVDAISTFDSLHDRDFFKQWGRVTNPTFGGLTPDGRGLLNPAGGPRELVRPYVSPTNWNQTGIINEPGGGTTGRPRSTLDKLVFHPDGTVSPLPFSGVGQLNGGCNCQAEPTQSYGGDIDDEVAAGNKRTNAFMYYENALSDNLTFFAQGLAGKNDVTDRRESISFVLTWAPRIFADNAYLPQSIRDQMLVPGNATPGNANTNFAPSVGFAEFSINGPDTPLGDARQITKNELFSGTVGFKGDLNRDGFFDGWHYDAYYQYGKNEQSFDTDNGLRVDRIPLALDAVVNPANGQIACYSALVNPSVFGDCVPMNIFGGLGKVTPEAARYIVDDYKHAIQDTRQDFLEFVMTGDVWEGFGAGAISGAFGTSYRNEELEQSTPDPTDEYPATPSGVLLSSITPLPAGVRGLIPQGQPGGIPGVRNVPVGFTGDANSSSVTFSSLRAIEGGYDTKEVFGELNIPIVADKGWANSFEVSTAVRWADYSGSGEVWAWKLGTNWQITDAVRFRATQSRDVRAATLRERFDQTRGGVTVNDPANLTPAGQPTSISTASFSGGNPEVQPENADTTTAGVVFQPRKIDRLSISVDWYKIDISDAIAQLTAQTIVNNCFGVSAPPDLTLCQYVHRDAANQITRVDNLFINLQTLLIEGVDLELNFRFTDALNWRLFASRLLENSTQNPGGPVDDRAGDIGTPAPSGGFPELKITSNLTFTRGAFSVFVQERYIDGGVLDRTLIEGVTIDDNTIESTYYTDLGIRYSFGRDDAWEIFGNVNNVFDEEPRVTAQALGRAGTNDINSGLYDVLGQRFVVGARRTF